MRTVTRICSLAVTAIMSMMLSVPLLPAAPRADGQLEIAVVDGDTGQPIAARMHLRNSRGRPVKLRWPGINQHAGHFYIDGTVALGLRRGQFTFDLEAGPEFRTRSGHFEIDPVENGVRHRSLGEALGDALQSDERRRWRRVRGGHGLEACIRGFVSVADGICGGDQGAVREAML